MRLNTRSKLILMVAIPIMALLYFSVTGSLEKAAQSREMAKLDSLVGLSVKIGSLAHELQKERGMSAGYLGSQGAKFAAELPEQRKASDKKLAEFLDELSKFDAGLYAPGLKSSLDSARQKLSDIDTKREAITSLKISGGDAIGYYTGTISQLLSVPDSAPTLSSNSEIARLATAYASLLQSKERAGIERAILSNAFSADRFTPALQSRFLTNSSAQDVYAAVFANFANEAQLAFYKNKLSGEAVNEVARLKAQASEKAMEPSLGGVDATYWFKMATERINLLKEVENRLADDLIGTADSLRGGASNMMMFYIALTLASVGATLAMAFLMIRDLLRQLGGEPRYAAEIANRIAEGDLKVTVETRAGDEHSLLAAMRVMREKLAAQIEKDRKAAAETLRIKVALDNATTNAMIADNDGNIVYANNSVLDMLRAAEADIRLQLPNFAADKVVGGHFDAFHKNPAHQRQMLANLKATHHATINVGPRIFNLTANPVINAQGERLGTSVEWFDATQQHRVQEEVKTLVAAAVNGDFTKRLDLSDKSGFMLDLSRGINSLSEITANGLNDVLRVAQAMADGDLTKTIESEYHGSFGAVKDGMNSTVAHLKDLIAEIKDSTDTINTAAREIAAGNSDLSQRTEQQASSLEETASSMEELTSTVKQNADNAAQANKLAIGASEVASKGGAVIKDVVETMGGINESSHKIVDIISVIDGIAFQTNILALNAAVEAARAGEQGRGFAVVAGEVRNLAQRSAAAAKEIKHLIDDSVGKVDSGSKLVEEAGRTMEEIVTAIRHVNDIMSEITSASSEQSAGIEQVNQAISQMDEVTQQNAALVEQAAAAAESLEDQARGLLESVGSFKVDAAAAVRPVPAKPAVEQPAKEKLAVNPVAKPDGEEWAEY